MADDARQGPLRVGDKFLKYVIQGLLGKGGHAWVYHGHDPFLEHDVAIKVLHRPGGATTDMLRRGRAEARLLYRLKHKHIVEVVDAGITDAGLLYIVMELLQGRTLRDILRGRGKLSLREALPLFGSMTEGVAVAHAASAIHRDLKPENIFVLHDNTPKILDFGIAKVVDSAGFTTEKDVLHGTLLYMSPEQLDGHRATAQSDIYAFGLMLYEALLGTHPCLLRNTAPTVRELALIHKVSVPPWLDELDPTVPRYVAKVVDRAITKLPEQRFGSMAELGDAIRDCHARYLMERNDAEFGRGATLRLPHAEPHDTERIYVPELSSESHAHSKASRNLRSNTRTLPLEQDAERNTVQPVTTRSAPLQRPLADQPAPARRQALRRVLIGGAVAGTLAGVTASFFMGSKEPTPSSAGIAATAAPRSADAGVSARRAPAASAGVVRAAGTSAPAASNRASNAASNAKSATGAAMLPVATARPVAVQRATESETRARPAPTQNAGTSWLKLRPDNTAQPGKPRESSATNKDREVWIQ